MDIISKIMVHHGNQRDWLKKLRQSNLNALSMLLLKLKKNFFSRATVPTSESPVSRPPKEEEEESGSVEDILQVFFFVLLPIFAHIKVVGMPIKTNYEG